MLRTFPLTECLVRCKHRSPTDSTQSVALRSDGLRAWCGPLRHSSAATAGLSRVSRPRLRVSGTLLPPLVAKGWLAGGKAFRRLSRCGRCIQRVGATEAIRGQRNAVVCSSATAYPGQRRIPRSMVRVLAFTRMSTGKQVRVECRGSPFPGRSARSPACDVPCDGMLPAW